MIYPEPSQNPHWIGQAASRLSFRISWDGTSASVSQVEVTDATFVSVTPCIMQASLKLGSATICFIHDAIFALDNQVVNLIIYSVVWNALVSTDSVRCWNKWTNVRLTWYQNVINIVRGIHITGMFFSCTVMWSWFYMIAKQTTLLPPSILDVFLMTFPSPFWRAI